MLPFILKIVKQFRKAGGTTNDFYWELNYFVRLETGLSINYKFHLGAAKYWGK